MPITMDTAAPKKTDRESGAITNKGSLISTNFFYASGEPCFMYNESEKNGFGANIKTSLILTELSQ